jgi:biopolymer transport protein ExbB
MLTLLQISLTEAANASQPTHDTLSYYDLALKGGWIMIPIFALSLVAVYIFIERYIAIKKAATEDKQFMNSIRNYILDGKVDSALALCKSNDTPVARMIEKGILRLGKPLADINTAIENVGNLEVAKLEKNIALLATAAGAAPMLGFLGTVTGMVKAFYNMSKSGNNIEIGTLSGGIYEAMVTTVAGLIVGILAYFLYNYIVSKIDKVVFLLEARSSEFMDLLHEPAN